MDFPGEGLLVFLLGLAAQAGIVMWRVNSQDKRVKELETKTELYDRHCASANQWRRDTDRRLDRLERKVLNGMMGGPL